MTERGLAFSFLWNESERFGPHDKEINVGPDTPPVKNHWNKIHYLMTNYMNRRFKALILRTLKMDSAVV